MDTIRTVLVLGAALVTLALALRSWDGTIRALCDFGLGGAASGAVGLGLYLYIPIAGQANDNGAPAIFTILFYGVPAGLLGAILCAILCQSVCVSRTKEGIHPLAPAANSIQLLSWAGALWLVEAFSTDAWLVVPGALSGALFGTSLFLYLWRRRQPSGR